MATPARADITIPAGGTISLSAGGLDAGCTDLIVQGTLQTNSAQVTNVRNLVIQSGGLIDAGASSISVGGNWTNDGGFTAGTSQVAFGDACGVNPAVISGNTTFHDLSFVSATGKTWQFASSSTQTVQNLLDVQGSVSDPLNLASTIPGQDAFIVVDGSQSTANFNATDITFSGNSVAPAVVPVPALSPFGLLVLLLLLSVTIVGTASRQPGQKSTWGH